MHVGVVALCSGVTLRKPSQELKLQQLQKVHVGRTTKLLRVLQQDQRVRRKHKYFNICPLCEGGSDSANGEWDGNFPQ